MKPTRIKEHKFRYAGPGKKAGESVILASSLAGIGGFVDPPLSNTPPPGLGPKLAKT